MRCGPLYITSPRAAYEHRLNAAKLPLASPPTNATTHGRPASTTERIENTTRACAMVCSAISMHDTQPSAPVPRQGGSS
eukprot:10149801-Alexandrium_andersonii.AAC.1